MICQQKGCNVETGSSLKRFCGTELIKESCSYKRKIKTQAVYREKIRGGAEKKNRDDDGIIESAKASGYF